MFMIFDVTEFVVVPYDSQH